MWQHKTRADTAWTDYSRNHNEQLTSAYLRQQEMLVLGVHVSGGNVKRWDVDLTEMEQRPNPMPTARFRRRLVRCYRKSDGAVLPAIGADRVLLWRNRGVSLSIGAKKHSRFNRSSMVFDHLSSPALAIRVFLGIGSELLRNCGQPSRTFRGQKGKLAQSKDTLCLILIVRLDWSTEKFPCAREISVAGMLSGESVRQKRAQTHFSVSNPVSSFLHRGLGVDLWCDVCGHSHL